MVIMKLTHKRLEMQGCIISTMATAALVLKHQAISIHSAMYTMYVFTVSYKNATFTLSKIRNRDYIFEKKKLFQG